MINVLDEDLEGIITRQEFYDALEAYNISGEKHQSVDGAPYYSFEVRTMFNVIGLLEKKDIHA